MVLCSETGCFALQKACFYRVKGAVLPCKTVEAIMHYTSDGYAIAILLSDLFSY